MRLEDIMFAISDIQKEQSDNHEETLKTIHALDSKLSDNIYEIDKKLSIHIENGEIHFKQREACGALSLHLNEHKAASSESQALLAAKRKAKSSYRAALIGAVATAIVVYVPAIFTYVCNLFRGDR